MKKANFKNNEIEQKFWEQDTSSRKKISRSNVFELLTPSDSFNTAQLFSSSSSSALNVIPTIQHELLSTSVSHYERLKQKIALFKQLEKQNPEKLKQAFLKVFKQNDLLTQSFISPDTAVPNSTDNISNQEKLLISDVHVSPHKEAECYTLSELEFSLTHLFAYGISDIIHTEFSRTPQKFLSLFQRNAPSNSKHSNVSSMRDDDGTHIAKLLPLSSTYFFKLKLNNLITIGKEKNLSLLQLNLIEFISFFEHALVLSFNAYLNHSGAVFSMQQVNEMREFIRLLKSWVNEIDILVEQKNSRTVKEIELINRFSSQKNKLILLSASRNI